jgi:hypothetical protein
MLPLSRFFLLLFAGLIALPGLGHAQDDASVNDALAIARTWLGEIDAGKYDQSYLDGGSALHDKVPQDTWVKILNTERPLLGKVVDREETSHVLHPDGLEGTNGTFLVISYHTNFAAKPDEVEYVVLRHEFTGWRCVGYDFGPANPQPADNDNPPTTTTRDETLTPPTSTNGMTAPANPNGNQ